MTNSTDTSPVSGEEEPSETSTPELPENFEVMGISEPVLAGLHDCGYFRPMEVQAVTYPIIRDGNDIMAQAQTGTGKTAAFGIPVIEAIDADNAVTQALCLAPTRELALQVNAEMTRIASHREIAVVPTYGGAPIGKQIQALEDGAHIVCGTPGRVLDHLRRKTLDPRNIKFLVLDECDEMLSMGFQEEIENIISFLPAKENRQTLLFSATLPRAIERIARRHMTDPVDIKVSAGDVKVSDISHYYYVVRGGGRMRDLLRILCDQNPTSAIIFCNTRDETSSVARYLQRHGLDAEAISSDLSQRDRERVMNRTRDKNLRFLVATDIAARGIDISDLSMVVNYTFPDSPEVYVHRTGRTGRAGKEGVAVSLIGPRDIGSFYFLKLTYQIEPEERDLPGDEVLAEVDAARKAKLEVRDAESKQRAAEQEGRDAERNEARKARDAERDAAQLEARASKVSALAGDEPKGRYLAIAKHLLASDAGEGVFAVLIEQALEGAKTTATRPASDDEGEPRRRQKSVDRDESPREDNSRGRRPRRRAEGGGDNEPKQSETSGDRDESSREGSEEGDGRPRRRRRSRKRGGRGRDEEATTAPGDGSSEAPDSEPTEASETAENNEVDEDRQVAADTSDEPKPKRKRRSRTREKKTGSTTGSGKEFWEAWAEDKEERTSEDRADGGDSADGADGGDGDSAGADGADGDSAGADDGDSAGDATVRLYVNIGKREEITSDDVRAMLSEPLKDGDADRIGSIALRSTHCYVRVPEVLADTIIEAIGGTTYKEREVVIERARR